MIPTEFSVGIFLNCAWITGSENAFPVDTLQRAQSLKSVTKFGKRDGKLSAAVILKMNGKRSDCLITAIGICIARRAGDFGKFPIPKTDQRGNVVADAVGGEKRRFRFGQAVCDTQHFVNTGGRPSCVDENEQANREQ